MPQRRSLRSPNSRALRSWLPTCEQLEDRSVPAVTGVLNGTILTVTLSAVADSASIVGTSSGGTAIDVTDVGASTTQSFAGVTAIDVIDGGSNVGQLVTFGDTGSGAAINLSGAIDITGIESVNFATSGALQADSLTVTNAGTAIDFHANVTTSGAGGQSYDGPAIVDNSSVTLDAGAAGGIAFLQTLNSSTGGGKDLVLNAGGITSFTAIVGGVNPLASLTTDAAGSTNLGANAITVGPQIYNDPATITGIAITLSSNTGGDIRFGSTLNASTSGANSLVVNTAGATSFDGVVGTTPLGGLSTDNAGSTLIKANISTIGAQTYADPVIVSGSTIVLASTVGANITFGGTLDGVASGPTALTVNTSSGATAFNANVGVGVPLGSITTDAGTGNTIVAAARVITLGAQTYNDPVRLNSVAATFASTQNANITFSTTLNGTTGISTAATFNTGGLTTFVGIVGQTIPITTLTTDDAGQPNEATVVQASVTTSSNQTYGDAVTFIPGTGVAAQTVGSTVGIITFQKTLSGASAVPVTVRGGNNVSFNGSATFSASGSRLNVQAGSTAVGALAFASGLTFKADVQTWQAGDGTGGLAVSTADLVTNAPSFRDAAGNTAPRTFVLRQDGAVTDATIPAVAQFGTAPPANYSILSDDSTLTLNTTTALAAAGTTNLTLSSALALSLGTTIDAPMGIVRLRSTTANVNQSGGGITSAGLGVRSGTSQTLTGTNAVSGPFASLATTSTIAFANGAPYTVGSIGADPLALGFASLSGVTASAGTVAFTQPGTSALNVTIAAAVSGTSVTATGGSGDDRVTVNYTIGGALPAGIAFDGNGGNDTLALSDAGGAAAHTYAIGATAVRDTNAAMTYSGVETVSVAGGTAADTFTITPDTTAAIAATGGLPTGTAGDKYTLTLAGTTTPSLTASKASDGFTGSATFGNKAAVSFTQMEALSPLADIQVTATASPALVAAGGAATITVVVKNAGPDTATGVRIDDVFPIGITASWTTVVSSGSTVAATSGTGDIHTSADLILSGTVTFTITATAAPGFLGTVSTTPVANTSASAFDADTTNNQAAASFAVQPLALTAVGAGAGGGPQVKVLNADGSTRFNFFAYDISYAGGVTVATGDVNGDGVEDIVTGSATSSSHVKVFDGVSGSLLASFFAFPGFTGGVNVAVAHGDVVVGAGIGGGPVFAGYHVAGGAAVGTFSLFAFDPSFRGGVQVAGSDDLISVGAGPSGSANVKVYDAATLNQVASFFAFPLSMTSGVNLAMGKSGVAETVIVGAGTGAAPNVVTVEARTGNIASSVQAFDASFTGGVRTASTTTGTGQPGTVFGAGPGGAPRVRILGSNGAAVLDFFAFDLSFTGGVYVG